MKMVVSLNCLILFGRRCPTEVHNITKSHIFAVKDKANSATYSLRLLCLDFGLTPTKPATSHERKNFNLIFSQLISMRWE